MSLYKKIFGQALKITWHNRFFWLLGFLTIFFGGTIELEFIDNFFGSKNVFYDLTSFSAGGLFKPEIITSINNNFSGFFTLILVLLGFILLLALILLAAVIGQIILSNRVYKLNKTNLIIDTQGAGVKKLINEHREQIVPVAIVNIAYKALVYLSFLLIALPIFFNSNNQSLAMDILFILTFIIFMPLAIIGGMISKLAVTYLAVYQTTIKEAVVKAFGMFKKNWLVSVETSFSLFVFSIIGTLAILFLINGASLPIWALTVFLSTSVSVNLFYPLLGLSIILMFIAFFILSSILSTFYTVSWVNLFCEFDKNGEPKGKIVRMFEKLKK